MHETSLFRSLLKQITMIAEEHDADRVAAVTVRVGVLANITPEHFREHFREVAPGTVAEGASLDVRVTDELVNIILESVDLTVPDQASG